MRSPRVPLASIELAALLAAGLFAVGFHATLPGRLDSEDDERRAAAALAEKAQPGDAVLLFPWWTERARLFVPEGLPVVGYLGSEADPLTEHPRIWVLSQPRLPRADAARFEQAFSPGRTPLGAEQRFGNLRLSLYRNGRYRKVLFSAVAAFEKAHVFIESNGAKTPCPFDGKGFRCPGPGNVTVAPGWHEILFHPVRCLWFHPPGGGARLVAELDGVPPGARLSLTGGLVWDRGSFHGPPYTVTHFGVDDAATGRGLLSIDLPPGVEGLQRAVLDTKDAGSAPSSLRIWSQSDNAELRDLCLELQSQGPEGQE